jgi:hypothetical protein
MAGPSGLIVIGASNRTHWEPDPRRRTNEPAFTLPSLIRARPAPLTAAAGTINAMRVVDIARRIGSHEDGDIRFDAFKPDLRRY